ncbi:hypothetical protein PMAYCL1PPCAC_20709, partial [Pristionchus mayeri]
RSRVDILRLHWIQKPPDAQECSLLLLMDIFETTRCVPSVPSVLTSRPKFTIRRSLLSTVEANPHRLRARGDFWL